MKKNSESENWKEIEIKITVRTVNQNENGDRRVEILITNRVATLETGEEEGVGVFAFLLVSVNVRVWLDCVWERRNLGLFIP